MFSNRVFIYLLLTCVSIIRRTKAESETKLCADPLCKDVLFFSYGTREHMLQDPNFLKFKQDQMVNITSFYFSAHPDFMEGKVKDENEQEKFGVLYSSFIDLIPYLLHLEESIEHEKEYYEVVHGPRPNAAKRVVGKKRATDLIKEYEGKAKRLNTFSIKDYSLFPAKIEPAKTEDSVAMEPEEAENIKKEEEAPKVNLAENVDASESSTLSATTSIDKSTQTVLNEASSLTASADGDVVPKAVNSMEKMQSEMTGIDRNLSDLNAGSQAVHKTQEEIHKDNAVEQAVEPQQISPSTPAATAEVQQQLLSTVSPSVVEQSSEATVQADQQSSSTVSPPSSIAPSVVTTPIVEEVPASSTSAPPVESTTPITHITTEDLMKHAALKPELPKFKTESNPNNVKSKNSIRENQINMETELGENNQVNIDAWNSGESFQSTTPSLEQKDDQNSMIGQGTTLPPLQSMETLNQERSSPLKTESTIQKTMHIDEKNKQNNDADNSEKKLEVNSPPPPTSIPIDLQITPTATPPTVQENSANIGATSFERISPENTNDKSHLSHDHETDQTDNSDNSEKKLEVNSPPPPTSIPIDLQITPTATPPTVQENSANIGATSFERISPENTNDKSHLSHDHETDQTKILQEKVSIAPEFAILQRVINRNFK